MAKKVKRSSLPKMPAKIHVRIEDEEPPISLNMVLAIIVILILTAIAGYMLFQGFGGSGTNTAGTTGQPPAEIAQQVSELQTRLQSNPNDVGALLDLGALYLNSDQLPQAETLFNKVVQLDPKNAEAIDYLGNIDYVQGSVDAALIKYNRSLELNPVAPYALYDKAYLLQFGKLDYAAAIPVWEKFIQVLGTGPDVDRAKKYIEDAKKALAAGPTTGDAASSTAPAGTQTGTTDSR